MTHWFFIIVCFLFLWWYFPASLADGKVTLIEMGTIAINFLCIVMNGLALLEKMDKKEKR